LFLGWLPLIECEIAGTSAEYACPLSKTLVRVCSSQVAAERPLHLLLLDDAAAHLLIVDSTRHSDFFSLTGSARQSSG